MILANTRVLLAEMAFHCIATRNAKFKRLLEVASTIHLTKNKRLRYEENRKIGSHNLLVYIADLMLHGRCSPLPARSFWHVAELERPCEEASEAWSHLNRSAESIANRNVMQLGGTRRRGIVARHKYRA